MSGFIVLKTADRFRPSFHLQMGKQKSTKDI